MSLGMDKDFLTLKFQDLFFGGRSETPAMVPFTAGPSSELIELTNPPNASDKYEKLGKLGEGSYGKVFKCRNKKTGEIVAIKRYHQVDDFEIIQKTALREIKILKMLNHPHIIKIVEVFRRSRKIHIVFEYCEFTLLTELNDYPRGYPQSDTVRLMYQIVDAIRYLHSEQIIYRDPKPENILLTKDRVVKLCDFGFARTVDDKSLEPLTEYVASRWYRAPELLVGGEDYGTPVDIWGIGCIMIEVLTGEPLWTGKTDLDHLYQIRGTFGDLIPEHMDKLSKNRKLRGIKLQKPSKIKPLRKIMPSRITDEEIDFLEKCLDVDPSKRWTAEELLRHRYFKDYRRRSSGISYCTRTLSNTSVSLLPYLPGSVSPAQESSRSSCSSDGARSTIDPLPDI
ncbi:UNVERIFIED_CONTAM: hypothetical protein RMT77_019042 [Armadillidium vulgare]